MPQDCFVMVKDTKGKINMKLNCRDVMFFYENGKFLVFQLSSRTKIPSESS